MATPNDNSMPMDEQQTRLNSIKFKLRSQRASAIWEAMEEVRQLLQTDPEQREVYGILLDSVQKRHDLREQIRKLIIEMMQEGSKAAEEALAVLPSSVQDLLADADDAYYAAEYEHAIQLYRQVLKLDINNERAKDYLAKAKSESTNSGESRQGIPRDAVQFYRRARSYIAAKAYDLGMKSLSAAIESAQTRGYSYPDAESLLISVQDSLIADEFIQKANNALSENRWKDALELYEKVLKLDPTNDVIRKVLSGLQGLLDAEDLLSVLENHQGNENERQDKLTRIEASVLIAEETKLLVNTSLLKRIRIRYRLYKAQKELQNKGLRRIITPLTGIKNALKDAKGNVSSGDPLLRFLKRQLMQIQMTRAGFFVLLIVPLIFFLPGIWQRFNSLPMTESPVSTPVILLTTAHPSATLMEFTSTSPATTIAPSDTATTTATAVSTSTETSTPTLKAIGTGYISKASVTAWDKPNGKFVERLGLFQVVTIVEQVDDHGSTWYNCTWETATGTAQGWILAEYVTFGPAPN